MPRIFLLCSHQGTAAHPGTRDKGGSTFLSCAGAWYTCGEVVGASSLEYLKKLAAKQGF